MPTSIAIGTRGSRLAMAQSAAVKERLEALWGDRVAVRLEVVRTTGDVDGQPLSRIGGQGVFTREIERALLDGRVDLAVHSLKDLPTHMDPGLSLVAVPEREDVRDVLVSRHSADLAGLPRGACVGTGSLRRQAQLAALRSDLRFVDLRGNVETRLRKARDGEVDAVVLAAAGLRRLGLDGEVRCYLDPLAVLPAPGQGALGLQVRAGDEGISALVAALDCPQARAAVTAERAFLAGLGGGCRAPIAAWGRCEGDSLRLDGVVLLPDGSDARRASATGSLAGAEALGVRLAADLRARGADGLLTAGAA